MDVLILISLLVINLGISFWNAKVCGQSWVEAKAIGGFIRVLLWCGAIQSAIGFSMVLIVIILFLGQSIIPPEVMKLAISMWYLTIIFPCLSTGFIIMIYSWVVAFKQKDLSSMGIAAWNTFAMAHNTYGAISGVGDAFKSIAGAISDTDGDGKAVMLAFLIAIIALFGGCVITAMIIKHYAGTVPIPTRSDVTYGTK